MSEATEKVWVWRMPCQVMSRVVGYITAVQNWNIGKKQEFKDRKAYVLEDTK